MDFSLVSWHDIDFPGILLAGLVAGYVMAVAGLWSGGIPGLVSFDIADFGRRYMVSDRPSAWIVGMISHLANSVILLLFWAGIIEPNLALPRWVSLLVWGQVLAVVLSGTLVAPMSGLGFLGSKTGSPKFALTSLLLHIIWSLVVAWLYR
ncbi:MAG: hypothetical protein NTZ05_12955 [Chloroflexi bacterium]|nr:hypothetical protein [Chloroflexota bacterium]